MKRLILAGSGATGIHYNLGSAGRLMIGNREPFETPPHTLVIAPRGEQLVIESVAEGVPQGNLRTVEGALPEIRPDSIRRFVATLLDAIPTTTAIDLRDKALLELFYDTGARVSEVAGLELSALAQAPAFDPTPMSSRSTTLRDRPPISWTCWDSRKTGTTATTGKR